MNINLAPIKYSKVLSCNGGPIESINIIKKNIYYEQEGYESYTDLTSDLKKLKIRKNTLFGNCDGTGSSTSKNEAGYIAISEAMETWAFRNSINNSNDKKKYGFNIEPTSTGMAAFPSLSNLTVKHLSKKEAIERWSIIEWWYGNLAIKKTKHTQLVEVLSPIKNIKIIIVWKKSAENSKYAYGFAAGKSLKNTIKKANIELFRNLSVLENQCNKNILINRLNLNEQRLLYFASPEGHNKFLERVKISQNLKITPSMPKKLIDIEIKGPWSKYATVWRTLFEQSSLDYQKNDDKFFLF